jgi:hypothetical protein
MYFPCGHSNKSLENAREEFGPRNLPRVRAEQLKTSSFPICRFYALNLRASWNSHRAASNPSTCERDAGLQNCLPRASFSQKSRSLGYVQASDGDVWRLTWLRRPKLVSLQPFVDANDSRRYIGWTRSPPSSLTTTFPCFRLSREKTFWLQRGCVSALCKARPAV